MQIRCKTEVSPIVLCALLLLPACAAAHPSFNDLLQPVLHDPTCKLNDQPTFRLFACANGTTLWYFTKPTHPAYPGVIKRVLSCGPAGCAVREEGTSFAPDDRQAPFKTWMAQIRELDAEMKAAIAREHASP